MAVPGPLRRRLSRLLRSERGQALPTALFAMIASFALASAAVLSTVDAQQGTGRDRESKNAIAAADAGANLALLRLNRLQRYLSLTKPCVGPNGEEQKEEGGWCPASPTESVGGSTFYYRVSAYKGRTSELNVVAVGTASGVSRRVEVGLRSYNVPDPFGEEKLIGQNNITLEGNATLKTSVGTNGSIEPGGNGKGSAEVCGNARVGIGQTDKGGPCKTGTYEKTEGERNLPPILVPENLTTENSDCRLVPNCTNNTWVDTYTTSNGKEPKEKTRTSTDPWDATHKTINLSENEALTMGGENYLVCGIYLKGGQLIMGNGGHVRIYVDTPEHCGLSAGATQVEISGNANMVSTGYNPAEGKYEVPVIYMLGSTTVATKAKLCGNSGTDELILYAPYSEVEMCGNATWIGMITGKSLRLNGNPVIESNPNVKLPENTIAPLWERTRYVECTGGTATTPNGSC